MADYEDKGSQIRVTNLEGFPMGVKAYVKIETNMGVTGWGEINNMETTVTCALARSLSELIIGEIQRALNITGNACSALTATFGAVG